MTYIHGREKATPWRPKPPRAPTRLHAVTITLELQLQHQLQTIAKQMGLSRSCVINALLRDQLAALAAIQEQLPHSGIRTKYGKYNRTSEDTEQAKHALLLALALAKNE